jgi:protein-S-isoprenylcysteine O-methyltransferase Ste14
MALANYTELVVLALLVAGWCGLHSALIAITVTRFFERLLGVHYRFYRLLFNMFAILTLAVVIRYQWSIRGLPVFEWEGYLRVVQVGLVLLGLLLFVLGARKYDARRFLGLTQIKDGVTTGAMTQSGDLDTSGISSVIRHPWYLALLLLIWARPLDPSVIVLNAVFSVYIVIGARLEERKLVREFGEKYRDYQERVSMLLPFKWLKARINGVRPR